MVCWPFFNGKKMKNLNRVRKLNRIEDSEGVVVYWMNRDQRVKDNYALFYAQELAKETNSELVVLFHISDRMDKVNKRQLEFMFLGLEEIEKDLRVLNIHFYIIIGYGGKVIPSFVKRIRAGVLVTDFSPLRLDRKILDETCKQLHCACYEVDAHNIIPVWVASHKQEYAARTLRPKVQKLLSQYLLEPSQLEIQSIPTLEKRPPINWTALRGKLRIQTGIKHLEKYSPGEKAALNALKLFIGTRLEEYNNKKNDPNINGQSNLSPYLHFGHLSSQRLAFEVQKSALDEQQKEAFLEQLIIRRELSENFCFYNDKYDDYEGFPAWAKKSLNAHRNDEREYIYSLENLDSAETHDALWNAAQQEMKYKGKMHGYMRMYWAKKILEWSFSPEIALENAIKLNNSYEIDGNDPNGYTGIAWSIGGVHDRPWFERPIFGQVRYMNYNGCKSKFDVRKYIRCNADF